jgi:hypothetical protein
MTCINITENLGSIPDMDSDHPFQTGSSLTQSPIQWVQGKNDRSVKSSG